MKCYVLVVLIMCCTTTSWAQSLPDNPQPGKCYVRCLDYDQKIEWLERDCNEAKEVLSVLRPMLPDSHDLLVYQLELQRLGYKFVADGTLSDAFVRCHNRYIRKQRKQRRREKRLAQRGG